MYKLIMIYTLNVCNFLCLNYTSLKLKKKKELKEKSKKEVDQVRLYKNETLFVHIHTAQQIFIENKIGTKKRIANTELKDTIVSGQELSSLLEIQISKQLILLVWYSLMHTLLECTIQ